MVNKTDLKESIWGSTKEAFETMVMISLEEKEGALDIEDEKSIAGSITFTGPIQGIIVIKTDCKSAEHIAKSMMMMGPEDEISLQETEDAIGEITNLIIGGIKTRLIENVGEIDISVPTMVTGQDIKPVGMSNSENVELCAASDNCQIQIMLLYKEAA